MPPAAAEIAFQRGDVWLLRGVVGDDANKQRPVLVISRDDLNRGEGLVIVPFHSQEIDRKLSFGCCVKFAAGEAGLTRECVAKCDRITAIVKTQIDLRRGKIGRATAVKMQEVVDVIRYVIRDESLKP